MSSTPNMQSVVIQTDRGAVELLFDLEIEGDTVHVKDLVVFPLHEQPLQGFLPEFLALRSQAMQLTKISGFARLRITGFRSEQSTSANPGKTIDVTSPRSL